MEPSSPDAPATSDRRDQQRAFTAAIAAHGNVRRAMREVGLTSPTTAYRWLARYRGHGAAWMTRASRRGKAVATDIADEVVALSEQRPTWGKDRIASELVRRHGAGAISPNGVRAVLREAGLWLPASAPRQEPESGAIDRDRLERDVREGIRLDAEGHPRAAADLLERALWSRLVNDPARMRSLLREPALGSWLQRGWLQLGHALIDSGKWRTAWVRLAMLDDWLNDDESLPPMRQRSFQDRGPWLVGPDGWRIADVGFGPMPGPGMEPLSLRQADIWVETQQYLGLLRRDKPGTEAVDRLGLAISAISSQAMWDVTTEKREHYRGILYHDRAVARIQGTWSLRDTRDDLERAVDDLAAIGNVGMHASAWANTARLHYLAAIREPHRATRHHDVIDAAADRALVLLQDEHSAMLRATIAADVTGYLLGIRPPTLDDAKRIDAVMAFAEAEGLDQFLRGLPNDPLLGPLVGASIDPARLASAARWHDDPGDRR